MDKEKENWYQVFWEMTLVTAKSKEEAEKKITDYIMCNDPDSWFNIDWSYELR